MEYRPKHLVDFHTHIFPEKVADRAVAALANTYGIQPSARPTPDGLLEVMDRVGIDISVALPVATRPDQVRSINDWAAATCMNRIICFGAMHPDLPEPAAEIERLIEMGVKGIKFQPQFQEFAPEEKRLWPIYEAMENRLIAVFHSGQEIVNVPHVYAQPKAIAWVHAHFPHLTMVVAHLGGFRMRAEAGFHLIGQAVQLETSFTMDMSEDDFRAAIRTHGVNKVLFGTDFPWGDPLADLQRLSRLGLSETELEAITWKNANNLLGLGLD